MTSKAVDQAKASLTGNGNLEPYELRISRLTIDKLGVKMYDRVSAVVAELVANGYDADAEKVIVRLPLATLLAQKDNTGEVQDHGFFIEVEDYGHGMTPSEAIDFYLKVGSDRRRRDGGEKSREKKRPVMGRKGIGKLAPFGICQTIEVISAGGNKTSDGYEVSHFIMEYAQMQQDIETPVPLERGEFDRTYRPHSGTTIRLSSFLPKRVPDETVFKRQLAVRFAFVRPDFALTVEDVRSEGNGGVPPFQVQPVDVPVILETRIELENRPVQTDEGERLPVKGWLAMARESYKSDELAGVRIYARDKIVATTRDFEQPAGFTGEFTVRSYLVGEVFAEWLDLDDGDDLVRSDRQGIIWDSDYGRALRSWGAELIKEIGRKGRQPQRERVEKIFLKNSRYIERAESMYGEQKDVVDAAKTLAARFGGFAAEDALQEEEYVEDLSTILLNLAPHYALAESFREFSQSVTGEQIPLDKLVDIFAKSRVAEMAAYSQIAHQRVKTIRELEYIVLGQNVNESEFQKLLARAPWLIEPTWTVITQNQALKTFKVSFEAYWKKRTGEEVILDIGYERKKPDFTLANVGQKLHIVEALHKKSTKSPVCTKSRAAAQKVCTGKTLRTLKVSRATSATKEFWLTCLPQSIRNC